LFDVAVPLSHQIADEEQKLWSSSFLVHMTIHEKLVIQNFSFDRCGPPKELHALI